MDILDAASVADARATLRAWAADDPSLPVDRAALVASELGHNVLRHAWRGYLELARGPGYVDITAVDDGPGLAEPGRALSGTAPSSAQGLGIGLAAVHRQSDTLDVATVLGRGTSVRARVQAAAAPAAGHALNAVGMARPHPGERECGDGLAVVRDGARVGAMVVDGLGHGPAAAEAAIRVVRAFGPACLAHWRGQTPAFAVAQALHAALRDSRGAAVSWAMLDLRAMTLTAQAWGNVSIQWRGADPAGPSKRVLARATTLGRTQTLREPSRAPKTVPLEPGTRIVLASDGVLSAHTTRLLHVPGVFSGVQSALENARATDDAAALVLDVAL